MKYNYDGWNHHSWMYTLLRNHPTHAQQCFFIGYHTIHQNHEMPIINDSQWIIIADNFISKKRHYRVRSREGVNDHKDNG